MTVPQITSHSAGTTHRTRLVRVLELANRNREQKLTLSALVKLCDSPELGIKIVTTQGAPNYKVRGLSWVESVTGDRQPGGAFPGRFKGSEALTADGLRSLLNYLAATEQVAQ